MPVAENYQDITLCTAEKKTKLPPGKLSEYPKLKKVLAKRIPIKYNAREKKIWSKGICIPGTRRPAKSLIWKAVEYPGHIFLCLAGEGKAFFAAVFSYSLGRKAGV